MNRGSKIKGVNQMSIAEAQFKYHNKQLIRNQDCWMISRNTFWDRNTVCMAQFLWIQTLFLQKLLHLPYLASLWRSKYLKNPASRFSKFSLYFAKIKMKVKIFVFWQNSALFSRKLCWLSLLSAGFHNCSIWFAKYTDFLLKNAIGY